MKLQHVFKDLLAEDFKSQTRNYIAQGIDPEIVKQYIDKFKHIKDKKYREMFDTNLDISVPPDKRNNIDAFKDFHELEQLVDYVGGQRPITSAMSNSGENIEVTGEAIYKDDNFEVYYADTPRACIKYKGKFPYSWCVARSDSSNMFYTYRFKPYEPAFYFVKDLKLTEKEFGVWNMTKNVFQGKFKYPYHFFVIQVPKNIDKENNENQQYIVSSANNDGDTQMSWDEILKINPKLAFIKKVLDPKPFTPEEREKNERFKNGIDDREFQSLSYEDKRSYLDIYPTIARPITTRQFLALPEDLMNLYVSFGIGLNDEQFAAIRGKKDLMKRYAQISERKLDEYLKEDNYNRRRLRMAYTELIVLPDALIQKYLTDISDKELNRFIHEYGEDKLHLLQKHLPHKFSKEHGQLKDIIVAAKNGDEEALAKLNEMVPNGIEVKFHNDDIMFEVYSLGRSYMQKLVDSDMVSFYDDMQANWHGGYNDRYFDDDESLEREYDNYIEKFISDNPDYEDTFKNYGLPFNLETVKDLLDTYGKQSMVEEELETEFSYAKEKSEEKEFDAIKEKVNKIAYVDDWTEIAVGTGAFIMYLTKYGLAPDEELSSDGTVVNNKKSGERFRASNRHQPFFTTDVEKFAENLKDLLENILDDYDVPTSYESVWERVNEAGWNFNYTNIDEESIMDTIERAVDKALSEFTDDDDSEEQPDDSRENVARLKSQIIGALNSTLGKLGKDPKASEIENDIVKMVFDRSRFNLNGTVYTKVLDKKNNQSHEGYLPIKDIPSYFTNYKLFEQTQKIKRLIGY